MIISKSDSEKVRASPAKNLTARHWLVLITLVTLMVVCRLVCLLLHQFNGHFLPENEQ
jgi:hypothetical protein